MCTFLLYNQRARVILYQITVLLQGWEYPVIIIKNLGFSCSGSSCILYMNVILIQEENSAMTLPSKKLFCYPHTPHYSEILYCIINQFAVNHLPLLCHEIFIHKSYCLFLFGSITHICNMHLPSLGAYQLHLLESTNECKGVIYNRTRMPSLWNFTCWKTFFVFLFVD